MRAWWALVRLDMRRTLRHPRYLVFAMAMPVGFYLLYSHMYGVDRAFLGTEWGAYFLVSMATFGVIGTTLNVTGTQVAWERGSGWTAFLRCTPLSGLSYVAAKGTTALAAAGVVTVLVTIAGALSGVSLGQQPMLPAVAAIWAGSVVFATLGLLLGQWLDPASITYGVTTAYLGLGFLGGLWTPLKVLPPVFTAIARWLPSYRVAELGWDILRRQSPHLGGIALMAAYVILFGIAGGILFVRSDARGA